MSTVDTVERRVTRPLRIISAALISGIVFALSVGLMLAPQTPPDPPVLGIVALVMAAATFPLAFLIPNILVAARRKALANGPVPSQPPRGRHPLGLSPADIDALGQRGALLTTRFTGHIVGCALLEGPALLGAVAVIAEGPSVFALVVPGLAIALMVLRFPTEGRVRSWLELRVSER